MGQGITQILDTTPNILKMEQDSVNVSN